MRKEHGMIDHTELQAAIGNKRSCNSVGAYYLLPALIWAHRADTIIEIGVRKGYTTSIFANVLKQLFGDAGRLISVDIDPNAINTAIDIHAEHLSLHNCVQHLGNSALCPYDECLDDIGAPDGKAKLIYVDGDHKTEAAKRDILATIPYLADDGVMVLHDFDHYMLPDGQNVPLAFAETLKIRGYNCSIFPSAIGRPFAVCHKPGFFVNGIKPEQRKW